MIQDIPRSGLDAEFERHVERSCRPLENRHFESRLDKRLHERAH